MAKLRVLSAGQVCAILAEHGFVEVRRRGSHIAMQQSRERSTITVIVPDQSELRTRTLRSIIRQSGLPRRLFEAR